MAITSTPGWLVARVHLSDDISRTGEESARAQAVIAALIDYGSTGVHQDGDALVAYYRAGTVDEGALRRSLALPQGDSSLLELQAVDDADWARAWRAGIASHTVGGLTIMPPWLADGADARTTVVIDPGMGFGTGEHPTTRCTLALLSRVVRSGDLVVDAGTGSGVLAIAAAKLGARRVAAIDMDPDAIGNAESNVRLNGVGDQVRVIEGDATALLPVIAPVDVISANIISSVLLDMLPTMRAALAPGGHAILSGILVDERDQMRDALTVMGWHLGEDCVEGQWWTTVVGRR
jgi:ribosomal protein L11 methyltransferase